MAEDIPVTGIQEEDLYPITAQTNDVDTPVIASNSLRIKQSQLRALLQEFCHVIQNKRGWTTISEHEIHVGKTPRIRQRPYRIPYSQREVVRNEVKKMLEDYIIIPSTSPWASPIVLVKKKDGGIRFCVDFSQAKSGGKI